MSFFVKNKSQYIPHMSTRYTNLEASRSKNNFPQLYEIRENCCGCSACFSICPVSAIAMEPDIEGFLYPGIDVGKCVRCYKCLSVCAFKKDQQEKGLLILGGEV